MRVCQELGSGHSGTPVIPAGEATRSQVCDQSGLHREILSPKYQL